MYPIVFASGNPDKYREIVQTFHQDGLGIVLKPQSDWSVTEAEETGETFVENALIKARHAAQVTGKAVLADDSGLVIDSLGGAPGVLSARYAGEPVDMTRNIEKVLKMLQGVPAFKRTARFCCVMVFMRDALDQIPIISCGVWEGSIASACSQGGQGFGYDPIFIDPETGLTVAEMSIEDKIQVSHRAQAQKQMIAALHSVVASA